MRRPREDCRLPRPSKPGEEPGGPDTAVQRVAGRRLGGGRGTRAEGRRGPRCRRATRDQTRVPRAGRRSGRGGARRGGVRPAGARDCREPAASRDRRGRPGRPHLRLPPAAGGSLRRRLRSLLAQPNSTDALYYFDGEPYTYAQATDDLNGVYQKLHKDVSAASYPTLFDSYTQRGFELDHMSIVDWI